ncbi:surface-adhesin E family protein [Providencia rustigianii]|uniref:surface-adhesin E family protein n=1 Tax=Providencia rustigianii TaxID=158850 RepID=UPI0038B2FB7F
MKLKLIILSSICISVMGCQSPQKLQEKNTLKSSELPAGYIKWMETKSATMYMAKPETDYYQGNTDLIQINVVTSLKEENDLKGIKFNSIKATHIYDCRKTNKYTERPIGFFANKYATGKPTIPYPDVSSRWEIAAENNFNAIFWQKLCELKNGSQKTSDDFVNNLNQRAPIKLNDWLTLIGAQKAEGIIHISYRADDMPKADFHQKLNSEIKEKQLNKICDIFENGLGLSKPKAFVLEYYNGNLLESTIEINDQKCQSIVQ